MGGFQPSGSPEPAGNWQWVTGEPFSYTKWAPGEPNNAGTVNEDSLHYWKLTHNWNDLRGNYPIQGYVVEYDGPFPYSFTDPDPDIWTATVDYGDGTGEQSLSLNPDKTFN